MPQALKSILAGIAAPLLLLLAAGVMYFMFRTIGVDMKPILAIIVALSPIWLPVTIFFVAFEQWMWSVQTMFAYKSGRVTLRIKLPQEVLKSPEAMESVLMQSHNMNSRDNYMQTYIDGKHPLTMSLELVSIGGEVRFYANVPTSKVKDIFEAQMYAQYPGIEIVEEKIDYTSEVVWDQEKWDMISFHFGKRRKDGDVYPIKTYVDYGLDKQPKEELKFEPMSPMLEYLGKAKPHERVWIQFLLTPHDALGLKEGKLTPKPNWTEAAVAEVNKLMGRDKAGLGAEETESRPILTMNERDTIAAIERNTSKYAFSTAIRAIYITENGKFDGNMISPLVRSFSQYDMIGRNGVGIRWRTDFNYNFLQDITGERKTMMKKNELKDYKSRYYLQKDNTSFSDTEKIMSVEEIATMWHIPGSSVVTPNLVRVDSVRKEAPANLPI